MPSFISLELVWRNSKQGNGASQQIIYLVKMKAVQKSQREILGIRVPSHNHSATTRSRTVLSRSSRKLGHCRTLGSVLIRYSITIFARYLLASDRHFYRSVRYPIEIWGLNREEFFSNVYWRTFNLTPSKAIEYVTWYRNQTCLFENF